MAQVFIPLILSLISVGLYFNGIVLLIDLIRKLKAQKSVIFTNDELAFISDNVRFLLDESSKYLVDEIDFELAEDDLMLAHSVLDKISSSGIKS